MSSDFITRIHEAQQARRSLLCVGIDPDPRRLPHHLTASRSPADAVLAFNRAIIEATAPYACAYKLNFAFFEALGADGWRVLEETVAAASREHAVVADAKRGDIGNSARFYASAVFEQLRCDACTVAPYMGRDSVEPFLAFPGRAAFVLVRTSNAGADEVQELEVDGRPLFLEMADKVVAWAGHAQGTVGFVLGATNAQPLRLAREAHPDVPLLVPGVGAQGGDAAALREALSVGSGPVLVNSSRQILYASAETDFAEAAAREAERIRESLGPPH